MHYTHKSISQYLSLAIMLSISMSIFGCDSCNQSPKEVEQQGTVEVVVSPDITLGSVGKIKLKIKGFKWHNDVWLRFKNSSAFTKEDGKPLLNTIELSHVLGKSNNEKMPAEGIEVELSIKASKQTQTDNKKDETLLLAVGNGSEPAAYISEQGVLTWKKQPLPIITVSSAIQIKGNEPGNIVLKNIGDPVKLSTILLTFSEDYSKFGDVNRDPLQEKMTLDKALDYSPEDIFNTNDEITLSVYACDKHNELNLYLSVGTPTAPTAYVLLTHPIVTWKAIPVIILSGPITIHDESKAEIRFTNAGPDIKMGDVLMTFHGDFNKFSDNKVNIPLNQAESLNNFYGCDPQIIFKSDQTLSIKVHALPEFEDDELKLKLSIGSTTEIGGAAAYVEEKEVVVWKEWES